MLRVRVLLLAQLWLVCSGCGTAVLLPNRCLMDMRDHVLAKGAWHRCGSQYDGPYRAAFKDGFIDGYENVCGGGDGQPPVVPPKKYQTICYSSSVGDAETIAWFNGFSSGAVAASADGREGLREVVLSTDADAGLMPAESSFPGFSSSQGFVSPEYPVGPGYANPPYEVIQPDAIPPMPTMVRPNDATERSVPRASGPPASRPLPTAPAPQPEDAFRPMKKTPAPMPKNPYEPETPAKAR